MGDWLRSGSAILDDAAMKISNFDTLGLHYNLVANQIYAERKTIEDPFCRSYLRYIVAGLISFDVGRVRGSKKYEFEGDSFAGFLERKLGGTKAMADPLMEVGLPAIDLEAHRDSIVEVCERLGADGTDSLNRKGNGHFYVGASKILHFLNPGLFIMVDSMRPGRSGRLMTLDFG